MGITNHIPAPKDIVQSLRGSTLRATILTGAKRMSTRGPAPSPRHGKNMRNNSVETIGTLSAGMSLRDQDIVTSPRGEVRKFSVETIDMPSGRMSELDSMSPRWGREWEEESTKNANSKRVSIFPLLPVRKSILSPFTALNHSMTAPLSTTQQSSVEHLSSASTSHGTSADGSPSMVNKSHDSILALQQTTITSN